MIDTTAIVGRATYLKVDDVILNTGIKTDNFIQNTAVPAVKDGYTRGVYTTVDSAGKTNVERQTNLALPYGNTADVERTVQVTESHTVLDGSVADQSHQDWAHDHATGGGEQTVVDPTKIVISTEIN